MKNGNFQRNFQKHGASGFIPVEIDFRFCKIATIKSVIGSSTCTKVQRESRLVRRDGGKAANVSVSGTATEIELFPRPGVMGESPLQRRGKTGGTAILIVLSYEGTFFFGRGDLYAGRATTTMPVYIDS